LVRVVESMPALVVTTTVVVTGVVVQAAFVCTQFQEPIIGSHPHGAPHALERVDAELQSSIVEIIVGATGNTQTLQPPTTAMDAPFVQPVAVATFEHVGIVPILTSQCPQQSVPVGATNVPGHVAAESMHTTLTHGMLVAI